MRSQQGAGKVWWLFRDTWADLAYCFGLLTSSERALIKGGVYDEISVSE